MNYIFDITLNLNDVYYDFFEWNKNDTFIHVRKIPIFKINNLDFCNIFNNNVVLEKDFFIKIKEKTEIYGKKNKTDSLCLFYAHDNIFAVSFNEEGLSKKISSLAVDDELDILESTKLKTKEIKYKIINDRKKMKQTRYEIKNKIFLQKQINSLNIDKDSDKIKYLYFEYFNQFNDDTENALETLKNKLNDEQINDNLSHFFKLSSSQN